jgi:MoxR-like ATPase
MTSAERPGKPKDIETGKARLPIEETERTVSYLGVTLDKAEQYDERYVPKREQYADYKNDAEIALPLQRDIAVALSSGDPLLIEGGTSLGKTTTIRKMAAELGYEVHYANLNGATDVQDLMGRYIPNPHKRTAEDPEYLFVDGQITSGLRKEEGKIKVIILDEFNASLPNIVIRLHEVLDALERGGDVVLSEDASETVPTSKEQTKVIALMNPPGKGYFGREPLDPAQLRRWVYKKMPGELPASTFSFATDALFGLKTETQEVPETAFLHTPDAPLSEELLREVPGIEEVLEKYKEFHQTAKELLKQRKLAADQPQVFSYDDRMEPRRVRDFVLRFYNGDVNETFQRALTYFYVNKLESDVDRAKLAELIRLVETRQVAPASKRKGFERPEPASSVQAEQGTTLAGLNGHPITLTELTDGFGFRVGQRLKIIPGAAEQHAFRDEVTKATKITVAGFDKYGKLVYQLDDGFVLATSQPKKYFLIDSSTPAESQEGRKGQEGRDPEEFLNKFFNVNDRLGLTQEDGWVWGSSTDGKWIDLGITSGGYPAEFFDKISSERPKASFGDFMEGGKDLREYLQGKRVIPSALGGKFYLEVVDGGAKAEKRTVKNWDGIIVELDGRTEFDGNSVGQKLQGKKGRLLRSEVINAKSIVIVGFTKTRKVVLDVDGIFYDVPKDNIRDNFEIVSEGSGSRGTPQRFESFNGIAVVSDGRTESAGMRVGQKLQLKAGKRGALTEAMKDLVTAEIVGFTTRGDAIARDDKGRVFTSGDRMLRELFNFL